MRGTEEIEKLLKSKGFSLWEHPELQFIGRHHIHLYEDGTWDGGPLSVQDGTPVEEYLNSLP